MFTHLMRVLHRSYKPLNKIEISKSALTQNYTYLSSLDSTIKIAPVLKSNAYGHDIVLIGKLLEKLSPPFLCVDSLFEAYQLQKQGIKTSILIMGYINPESLNTKSLPFSFAVYTTKQIEALKKYQPAAKIHIFVDTGMHREGVSIDELPEFLKNVQALSLNIEGLMSHFGMSDKPNDPLTQTQIKNFEKAQSILSEHKIYPRWIHIGNSSGALNSNFLKGKLGNVARTGIALYGIDPQGKNTNLKPVLSFKTTLAQIKTVKKGERIGYDFTFTANNNMKLAVLPVGYNDGIDRRLTNTGYMQINTTDCLIIGRVSMNITVVDITNLKNVEVGHEVTVFSNNTNDKNSIYSAAQIARTIPYELLVHLSSSTKREVVQ